MLNLDIDDDDDGNHANTVEKEKFTDSHFDKVAEQVAYGKIKTADEAIKMATSKYSVSTVFQTKIRNLFA